MPEDARQRTKAYLEQYLNNANLTEDDDSTQVSYMVAFGRPSYPLTRIFNDKEVDLVFSVNEPDAEPNYGVDLSIYGYVEHVPIECLCVDKRNITAVKLAWKAEVELRRIAQTYPTGSLRPLERGRPEVVVLGSTRIYVVKWTLIYERDTT